MNLADIKAIYDYSLWEKAMQAFFCDETQGEGLFATPPNNDDPKRAEWTPPAGQIAIFTASQSAVFQAVRPRVSILPMAYTPLNERALIIDADGRPQNRAFMVPVEFDLVTKPDYDYHIELRAVVCAIVAKMNPLADFTQIQTTGLNAFLTVHELGKIWDAGNSMAVGIIEKRDAYATTIKFNATFAVRASAWPGGQQNA